MSARSRIRLTLAAIAALGGAGCPQAVAPVPAAAVRPEPAWEELLAAVRDGQETALIAASQQPDGDQFRQLLDIPALTRLEVDNARVDGATLREVLATLPSLTRLKLSGPVDDDDLEAVSRLPELTVLNLPAGAFTDAGLRQLERHPRLELLRLHSPQLTDEGLRSLPHLPALRFLHLIDVPITDEGLLHLYGLTTLESFYLDGGACTEDGLSQLLERLPQLHFHWNQLHLPGDPRAHPHSPRP